MISLKYSIASISIDTNAFQQQVERRIERVVRLGAFAFLRAAAPRIRVRTGFAHGSLRSLAKALGTDLPPGTPGTRPRKKEFYYFGGAKILKTPFTSAPFATPISMVFQKKSGALQFKFEIDISYFQRNDTQTWRSFEYGLKAYEQFVDKFLETVVPDLNQYIRITQKTF